MDIIEHISALDTETIIEHYTKKDGISIVYVCTTELDTAKNLPIDIFYRNIPHPQFGNQYFGMYSDPFTSRIMITNADSVEDLTFDCIVDDGKVYYSRYRRDFMESPNGLFIDGGREYTRTNATEIFTYCVRNGRMAYDA